MSLLHSGHGFPLIGLWKDLVQGRLFKCIHCITKAPSSVVGGRSQGDLRQPVSSASPGCFVIAGFVVFPSTGRLCMLGKRSTTKLYPYLLFFLTFDVWTGSPEFAQVSLEHVIFLLPPTSTWDCKLVSPLPASETCFSFEAELTEHPRIEGACSLSGLGLV